MASLFAQKLQGFNGNLLYHCYTLVYIHGSWSLYRALLRVNAVFLSVYTVHGSLQCVQGFAGDSNSTVIRFTLYSSVLCESVNAVSVRGQVKEFMGRRRWSERKSI